MKWNQVETVARPECYQLSYRTLRPREFQAAAGAGGKVVLFYPASCTLLKLSMIIDSFDDKIC
jgi:hypothetical protein